MEDYSISRDSYQKLYQDFLHPNPNINNQAVYILKHEFPLQFMQTLLKNLNNEDIVLRRKSILALGEYGEESFNNIVQLYLKTNNRIIKVSCLKSIIKCLINYDLKNISEEVMSVLNLAMNEDHPEIILSAISLLKLLGLQGRSILMKMSKDKDLLKAKASVSVLMEINEPLVDIHLKELLNDESIDPMIKDSIFLDRDKIKTSFMV